MYKTIASYYAKINSGILFSDDILYCADPWSLPPQSLSSFDNCTKELSRRLYFVFYEGGAFFSNRVIEDARPEIDISVTFIEPIQSILIKY
jgi:hypothetical protein